MPLSVKNVSIVAHSSFASSSVFAVTFGLLTTPTGTRYAPLNLSGFCTTSGEAAAKADVYAPTSEGVKKGYMRISTSHETFFSCGLRENVLTEPGWADKTVIGDPCALSFRCSSDAYRMLASFVYAASISPELMTVVDEIRIYSP